MNIKGNIVYIFYGNIMLHSFMTDYMSDEWIHVNLLQMKWLSIVKLFLKWID